MGLRLKIDDDYSYPQLKSLDFAEISTRYSVNYKALCSAFYNLYRYSTFFCSIFVQHTLRRINAAAVTRSWAGVIYAAAVQSSPPTNVYQQLVDQDFILLYSKVCQQIALGTNYIAQVRRSSSLRIFVFPGYVTKIRKLIRQNLPLFKYYIQSVSSMDTRMKMMKMCRYTRICYLISTWIYNFLRQNWV